MNTVDFLTRSTASCDSAKPPPTSTLGGGLLTFGTSCWPLTGTTGFLPSFSFLVSGTFPTFVCVPPPELDACCEVPLGLVGLSSSLFSTAIATTMPPISTRPPTAAPTIMSGFLEPAGLVAAPFSAGSGALSSSGSSPRRRPVLTAGRSAVRLEASSSTPRRRTVGAAARGPGRTFSAGSIASSISRLATPLTAKISSHFLQRIFLPFSSSASVYEAPHPGQAILIDMAAGSLQEPKPPENHTIRREGG